MITNALESKLRLEQLLWYGLIAVAALGVGYLLANNFIVLLLCVGGVAWLVLLPYHTQLSVYVAQTTFTSALILPFFPGRPYWWEFAALLGWSGALMTISLRRYPSEAWETVRSHRWLFLGIVGYCVVLVITMYYRGLGFRILGSEQMGGRFYFQQLACAIFPVTFLLCPLEEKTMVRLFVCQCALAATYLISDFVFAIASQRLFFLLQFFELPNDAISYERQALEMGLRRYQSLYSVSVGLFLLLLIRFRIRDFFGRKSWWLIPLTVGIVAAGLLGGARYLLVVVGLITLFCMYGQRFFTVWNTTVFVALLVLGLTPVYLFARDLPLSAQRAVSFLPGIQVDAMTRADGAATMETRRILRKIGMDLAPQYFWVGRGFGQSATGDFSVQWDPTTVTLHVNMGRFYNGFIGLLVNTGIFGTFFMMLFIISGSTMAWRVMKHLHVLGCDDTFLRMCCLVAAVWMTYVPAFLFMHGDSEIAMKTFSLQCGVLLVCENLLKRRRQRNIESA